MFLIEILGEGCVALGHSLPSATAAGDFRQSPLLGFKKQRKSTTDHTSTGRAHAGVRNGAREDEGRVGLPTARRGDVSVALGEAKAELGPLRRMHGHSAQTLHIWTLPLAARAWLRRCFSSRCLLRASTPARPAPSAKWR